LPIKRDFIFSGKNLQIDFICRSVGEQEGKYENDLRRCVANGNKEFFLLKWKTPEIFLHFSFLFVINEGNLKRFTIVECFNHHRIWWKKRQAIFLMKVFDAGEGETEGLFLTRNAIYSSSARNICKFIIQILIFACTWIIYVHLLSLCVNNMQKHFSWLNATYIKNLEYQLNKALNRNLLRFADWKMLTPKWRGNLISLTTALTCAFNLIHSTKNNIFTTSKHYHDFEVPQIFAYGTIFIMRSQLELLRAHKIFTDTATFVNIYEWK
jgi:hypothetical protein